MHSVSVVIPTLNEESNIPVLYERLARLLSAYDWEIMFVDDDSKDNTLAVIDRLSAKDRRVRRIHRIGRSGLSSACIEGIMATRSEFIVIMDADLQHDEMKVPDMLAILAEESADVVVGSRYISGGGLGDWGAVRRSISQFATYLSEKLFTLKTKDPMSGFFAFNRMKIIPALRVCNGKGFKILFDILTAGSDLRVTEVPYTFRSRGAGDSKLSFGVMYDFYITVLYVLLGRKLPAEFISFVSIGLTGVVLHSFILLIWMQIGYPFIIGQFVAGFIAMNSNFFVNNITTHRISRIRLAGIPKALVLFWGLCSLGLIYNVISAEKAFRVTESWFLAGLFGSLISAVWNYATTAVLVWGRKA